MKKASRCSGAKVQILLLQLVGRSREDSTGVARAHYSRRYGARLGPKTLLRANLICPGAET